MYKKGTKDLGLQITEYIRAILNEHGIPWGVCEQIGMRVNRMIEDQVWLSTDSGITFEKTFIPKDVK